MSTDFDIIVVGSGPAGVSAAQPLLAAGVRVLMVDGGKKPDQLPQDADFLAARASDRNQWKWMVGADFHALKNRDAASPKLRVAAYAYAFEEFQKRNQVSGEDFLAVGSLATGGLSNAWGCGVARFSARDMADFPFAASELEASYARISRRIGISGGVEDDMSDYFGLDAYSQPPIPMDALHTSLLRTYVSHRAKLHAQGFRLGRSRVAALSEDLAGRRSCNLSGNCLWGCHRGSLYSASQELPALRRHENFSELSGFVVEGLARTGHGWAIEGQTIQDGERRIISASRIVLAAGTLATTRLVLNALRHRAPVPLLSSPTAAFLLMLPRLLGTPRTSGFGLGQLSFSLATRDDFTAFGSLFATTGIAISEFVRHLPFRRRYGVDILNAMLSSCAVGNIFLPGHLTNAQARLRDDGSLRVSGAFREEVGPIMQEANRKLSRACRSLGAILLPGSFTVGQPGGDIHYAGTLPMKIAPEVGETSALGEVKGLDGIHVVDGACLSALPEKSHTLTIMANADRIAGMVATLACADLQQGRK